MYNNVFIKITCVIGIMSAIKKQTAVENEELSASNFALKKLSRIEYLTMMALYGSAHALGALEIQKWIAQTPEYLTGKNNPPPPSYMRVRRILESFANSGIVKIRNVKKEGHGHASTIYYLPNEIIAIVKAEAYPHIDGESVRLIRNIKFSEKR